MWIRGTINDWFVLSYLSSGTQSSQTGSIVSKKENLVCGVTQGSLLGPLLVLITVNDMHRSSPKFNFYLFDDETNLLCAEIDLRKLEISVNQELSKLRDWLDRNKSFLNPSQSNFVIFHPFQPKLDYELKVIT